MFSFAREEVECVWLSLRLSYWRNKIMDIYAGILVKKKLCKKAKTSRASSLLTIF